MPREIDFYFENDCAYTEDDKVCISNLFIWAKKPLILSHELEEYCIQNYGAIKKCRIGKCGYVIFKDPRDAARMLWTPEHQYGENKHFYVRPSYSWLQPDVKGYLTTLDDDDAMGADENAARTSIVDLNDDCLLAIFDYLDFSDQFHVALANTRFGSVFKFKNPHRFKSFNFNNSEKLTLWQRKNLLQVIGDDIETIETGCDIENHFQEILRNVATYCVNLRSIEFSRKFVNIKTIRRFIRNCRQIQDIYLNDIDTIEKSVGKLRYFSTLEVLRIYGDEDFSGKNLNKLRQLKELRFHNCQHLKAKYIARAVKKMRNLRCLRIEGCFEEWEPVKQIIQAVPDLEALYLSTDIKGNMDFSSLRCLKEFSIDGSLDPLDDGCLKNLAHTQSENLQVLRMFSVDMVCPERALEIGKFKNLRKLVLVEDVQNMEVLSRMISKLIHLEEIILDYACNLNRENLMILLRECCKLHTWRLLSRTEISTDLIESMIVLLKEQFKSGERNQKLKILEHFHESDSEDAFDEDTKRKYDSPELEVISKRNLNSSSDFRFGYHDGIDFSTLDDDDHFDSDYDGSYAWGFSP